MSIFQSWNERWNLQDPRWSGKSQAKCELRQILNDPNKKISSSIHNNDISIVNFFCPIQYCPVSIPVRIMITRGILFVRQ